MRLIEKLTISPASHKLVQLCQREILTMTLVAPSLPIVSQPPFSIQSRTACSSALASSLNPVVLETQNELGSTCVTRMNPFNYQVRPAQFTNPWLLFPQELTSINQLHPKTLQSYLRSPTHKKIVKPELDGLLIWTLVDGFQCSRQFKEFHGLQSTKLLKNFTKSPVLVKGLIERLLDHGNLLFALNVYISVIVPPNFTIKSRILLYDTISQHSCFKENTDLDLLLNKLSVCWQFMVDFLSERGQFSSFLEFLLFEGETFVQKILPLIKVSEDLEKLVPTQTINTILYELSKTQKNTTFSTFLNLLQLRRYPFDNKTFNIVLNHSIKTNDQSLLYQGLQELESGDIVPNTVTCNILLKAFSKFASPDTIERIINILRTSEFKPDEVTPCIVYPLTRTITEELVLDYLLFDLLPKFNSQSQTARLAEFSHRLFPLSTKSDKFVSIVKSLLVSKHPFPMRVYNLVMFRLVKVRAMNRAESILQKVLSYNLTPPVHMWTILIQGYLNQGNELAVVRCLSSMEQRGLRASTVTLHKIYLHLRNYGPPEHAQYFIDTIIQLGIMPHHNTINTHIHLLASLKRDHDLLTLLHQLDHDFTPDTCTFNILICCALKHNSRIQARSLLRAMSSRGLPINQSTYVELFRLTNSRFNDGLARHVYRSLLQSGLRVNGHLLDVIGKSKVLSY